MKPIVHYIRGSNTEIIKGDRVTLFPIDHTSPYVSNTRSAITSPVQEVFEDGMFETLNSRYIPIIYVELEVGND